MKKTKEIILEENKTHISDVRKLLLHTTFELINRSYKHDWSKEIPGNAQVLADCLNKERDWKDWDDIHFKQEDHHPEYYDDLKDINLFALIEMVADGCAANFRRNKEKGTWQGQFDFYTKRKGFSPQTAAMMANTFMIMQGWLDDSRRNV